MRLRQVPAGTRIFVDSGIFIYHFTGASSDCRAFLERCEKGEVRASTSVLVLAEVTHRLMMVEALVRGLVSAGNLAKKLRKRPAVVRKLNVYQEQVEKIPLMGIEIEPVDLGVLLRAADYRRAHGLLTNDSLVAAAAVAHGREALASADEDFRQIPEVKLYRPSDLGRRPQSRPR